MARKRKKPARKPKKPTRKPKTAPTASVVDIQEKRIEKIDGEIRSLAQSMTKRIDEHVALVVGAYHAWQLAHPALALKPRHKLEMVRFGFVGPGGFERCHEPHRLPDSSFVSEDGHTDPRIRGDHNASEYMMCPAMEAGLCQEAWRGMSCPPCYLLLLEIHHGLGGGALDESVEEVLADFGRWDGPEQCAESFTRGAQLVEKHRY